MSHSHLHREFARRQRASLLRSLSLAAGVGFLALALAPAQDPAAEDPASGVELTRNALEQLIEAKRLIAQEKRDWAEGRELMQDRIDVVRSSIEKYRGDIAQAETNIRDTDEQRAELGDKHAALEATAAELRLLATDLETRLKALLPQLPEPLQEKVQPLVLRFPEEGNELRQSLGARFGTIGGILQEIDKFALIAFPTSELHTLEDGSTANVSVVYLGLGLALAANAEGTKAEVGRPGPEGWVWTPAPAADLAQIVLALQVARGEEGAVYTLVPAEIR